VPVAVALAPSRATSAWRSSRSTALLPRSIPRRITWGSLPVEDSERKAEDIEAGRAGYTENGSP
jgi:hypothetical protein